MRDRAGDLGETRSVEVSDLQLFFKACVIWWGSKQAGGWSMLWRFESKMKVRCVF